MVILYLPKVASGEEPYVERFVPLELESMPEDDGEIDTGFLSDPSPDAEVVP
jgi:hypothetical protein